jgi:protein SDA1
MAELLRLLERCKKHPDTYLEDFLLQLKHFESSFDIIKMKPNEDSRGFCSLTNFVSTLSSSYKKETEHIPGDLLKLLEEHCLILSPPVRNTIVGSLIQFRKSNSISPKVLLPAMFKLFRVHDKILRKLVFHHIVADIVRMNEKKLDTAMNRYLQNFMYQMMADPNRTAAKKSLDVMIQLYHKKVWNDDRTVNVLSLACLSDDSQLLTAGLKFFLGTNSGIEDEDEVDKKMAAAKKIYAKDTVNKYVNSHSKKTSKKETKYKKALKNLHRNEKELEEIEETESKTAIELLNDPQHFAEKLFGKLKNTNERFEVRIMMMDVISKCIAYHKLILLNFYPYFSKYLEPFQKEITKILAIAAQATHDIVPPETIEPLVMTIANHFVTDRSSPEAISSGLNTIREICARQPLVMTTTLLSDLTRYIKVKNRYIVHAARGLVTLFRRVNPNMLRKRDRGRDVDLTNQGPVYGEGHVDEGIEGLELLQAYKEGKLKIDLDDEEGENDEWSDEETITEEDLKESLAMLEQNRRDDVEDEISVDEEEQVDEDEEEEEEMESGEEEEEEEVEGEDEVEEEEEDEIEEDEENPEEFDITEDDIQQHLKPRELEKIKDKEAKDRANIYSTNQILSQEDFEILAKLKRRKELANQGKKKLKPSEVVEIQDIESTIKKTLKNMKLDGEVPEKDKVKWKRKNDRSSKTNREKNKNKPFMMSKYGQGVKKKNKMGQQERAMKTYKARKKNLKFSLKHF